MTDKQRGETRSKRSEEERKDAIEHPLATPAEQAAANEPEADKAPERPVTEASGIFGEDRGGTAAEKEAVKEIHDAHPTRAVRIIRGYQRREGEEKLPPGTELELPIEDARFLIESNIAELIDPDFEAAQRKARKNAEG